ncbi:MAG TPA: hypothetical protein VFX22_09665 [Candidatus Kapabacteria bacterium]|nr:hypothetical protein [Candidatus Kapabacteria bacterium]
MTTTNYPVPASIDRYGRNGLIAAVIGFIALVISIFAVSPTQFFHSYFLGYMVFVGLCVGSLGLLMLQYVSGGAWGVITRRIYEAASRVIPIAALLFIPIFFGMKDMYTWTNPTIVKASESLSMKTGWLNTPFWIIRTVVYFAFWISVSIVLNRYSKNLDESPGFHWSRKLENFSGGGFLFHFVVMTLASVDWMMSLLPQWYSTIYGFIIIVGQGILALTFAIIILAYLIKQEPLASVIKPVHLHDLGKLLFALNFLWGYLCFSQLIITYSGNLPEEILWYHQRIRGGWVVIAYLVIFVHFVLPFALLLSRDLKRSMRTLVPVACLLFVMRIVDMYWLIEPNWHGEEFFISWADVAAPLGFVGLFLFLFVREYKKRNMLPLGEPELELTLHPKGVH